MGVAAAALGWPPREFWRATPVEVWTAVKAYERMHSAPGD